MPRTPKGVSYSWPPSRTWAKPQVTRRPARDTVEVVKDTSWMQKANCLGVDTELFFPERGDSTREAKAVCRGCEVKDECLEYALENGEKFGIWGEQSERERRRMRRVRRERRQA